MSIIDVRTSIFAPLDRVFDLARDIDLHASGMASTGERAVAGRTSGLIEFDEMVTWRARHFGLWWRVTSRVTAMEPPLRFVDEQVSGPFGAFRHEHLFEQRPDGETLMTDHWSHRAPLGALGRIADRLFLERYMRRQLEIRAESIRLVAEADREIAVEPAAATEPPLEVGAVPDMAVPDMAAPDVACLTWQRRSWRSRGCAKCRSSPKPRRRRS